MHSGFYRRFTTTFVLLLVLVTTAPAATEYFVSLDGCDATHDGRSREGAFATIQKGVDALDPGDTLTILPGEYFESVRRLNLGSDDVVTTLRAEIPGTVVLRGDIPAPPFDVHAASGAYTIYAAALPPGTVVRAVNELDSLMILQATASLADLQFMPGAFYQAPDSGRLYLTTVDSRPVGEHRYSLSVLAGNGLHLSSARREIGPRRVVVEGLAATGFNATQYGDDGTGILLSNARESVVRNCHAWLNGWGITVSSEAEGAGGNVIEGCVAWANDTMFANSRIGGIIGMNHRGDSIRDSTAFLNANCGIYLRGDADPALSSKLQGNLAWGNRWDFIIKGNPGLINVTERGVAGVYAARKSADHALFMRGRRAPGDAPGTIILSEEADFDPDREFADFENHDYRLQATSRFRGTGPEGGDRGPFPYAPTRFFVSPEGDDAADGRSLSGAWQTLARGVRDLKPGDTLYLQPGIYTETLTLKLNGSASQPIRILGRGRGPTVLRGMLTLTGSSDLAFQRLHFEGQVTVEGSREVDFAHCGFSGAGTALTARETTGLKVKHSRFANFDQTAVDLRDCVQTHLSGNLYENQGVPALRTDRLDAVRYADYNAFRDGTGAWEVAGTPTAMDDLPDGLERYSATLPDGYVSTPEPLDLTDRPAFAAFGPLGHPFGPFRTAPRRQSLRLVRAPYVHAVGSTTADIEWGNLLPGQVHLAWGDTPELAHRDVVDIDYFGSYSLTGLEPGRTYHFRIESLAGSSRSVGQHDPWRPGTIEVSGGPVEGGLLTFTTLTDDPAPTRYWVAPDGDDAQSGLERAQAWRTLQHAADQVRAGDTVWIAGGTYEEQVRIRASGQPGAPITFRSAPGEKVILSAGPRELNRAFTVEGKQHLRFDGFYLLSQGFYLKNSDHVEISRMFAGRYGSGYAPGFLNALGCRELTIRNSVALSAKGGPGIHDCANVRIENCVFFRNMITQLGMCTLPGRPILLANNIFTDGLGKKFSAPMINLGRFDAVTLRDNAFYPRRDWQQKTLVCLYSDDAFERCRIAYDMGETDAPHPVMNKIVNVPFAELDRHFGTTGSLLANPGFAGLADVPETTEDGRDLYPPDRMTGTGVIPLDQFFATHPELIERGIGLQPEAFADFHFNQQSINDRR